LFAIRLQYYLQHFHDKGELIKESRGEMFMKELSVSVLVMLGVLLYVGTAVTELNLKGYQALEDYRAKSLDEAKIVKVLLDYQKAYNLYDAKRVLTLYLPGAIIKAGMKDDRSDHMVTKELYFDILTDKLTKWKMYNFKLKLFTPKKRNVEGNNAKLDVPFIIYSIAQDYWEKGIFNFDFRKVDSRWLISKNTWEVVDLSYNP
jgi:hypothetical protein